MLLYLVPTSFRKPFVNSYQLKEISGQQFDPKIPTHLLAESILLHNMFSKNNNTEQIKVNVTSCFARLINQNECDKKAFTSCQK